tara:strand:- start:191 stop:826 length:636 start_codon:yes stop_codon:yes gene_type:complete
MSDLKVDGITAATSNTAVTIKGLGTGKVVLGDGNLVFPDADGAAGTFITTNGSAALSFAAAGRLVQMVNVNTGALATGTTVALNDDSIPQKTEGNEFMTLAITPTSSSNKLRIQVNLYGSMAATSNIHVMALFQDSTANALTAVGEFQNGNTGPSLLTIDHYMTAGTTNATTFKVRVHGDGSGTYSFNGVNGSRKFGGVANSSITITEISA